MRHESFFPTTGSTGSRGISAVLQTKSPARCFITTERGDEVPLSLAGYKLKFGQTYYVNVDGDAAEVRLVGYPNLVRRREEGERHKHGRSFRYVQIRVGPTGLSKLGYFGAYPRDLEVEIRWPDDQVESVEIPIVVERSLTWRVLLFFVLLALVFYMWDIFQEAITESLRSVDFGIPYHALTDPRQWVVPLVLALLAPIIRCLRRFGILWARAHELKQRFLQTWVAPAEQLRERGVSTDEPTVRVP